MFSFIVPVYNSEETIKRCLDSIIGQTFREFEVLIIDDGSTDNSNNICREYAERDDRIKIFKQNNRGPSAARNKGLDVAIGEYICFVDSDDYISNNYLESINNAVGKEKIEVIYLSFDRIGIDGQIASKSVYPDFGIDYYQNLINLSKADVFGYTWSKVIRRDVIGDVRFDEGMNLFEDEVFTCEILKRSRTIKIVENIIYHYVRTESDTLANITHQDYASKCDKAYCAWKNMLPESVQRDEYLKVKAQRIMKNCYYYAMERDVDIVDFCKKISTCEFIKDVENSGFANTIKRGSWWRLKLMRTVYRTKVNLSKLIKN